jgi:hypothetical protein
VEIIRWLVFYTSHLTKKKRIVKPLVGVAKELQKPVKMKGRLEIFKKSILAC